MRRPAQHLLILASTSPYRKMLLERLGIPFDVVAPSVDETPRPQESPKDLAQRLSTMKSLAGASLLQEGLIIGSDQVACLGETLLGKPGNRETAFQQLSLASGQTLSFYTGISVTEASTGKVRTAMDVTQVSFRDLTPSAILRYLDRETPYDCAGSFKAEGYGITLLERIESQDPTGLIGLPLIQLSHLLRAFGLEIP